MSIVTVANTIIAIAAVGALILSIYNTCAQRRDAAKQEERWESEENRWQEEKQQQEERWREEEDRQQREREPSLLVEIDSRSLPDKFAHVYSCRIVNDGYVPVEIRTLRIVLDDGRTFPMPELPEDLKPMLWENERPITKPAIPTVLQSGRSIRYATLEDRMKTILRNAGSSGGHIGFAEFSIAVVDALGNHYTAEGSLLVGSPEPEP